MERLLCSQRKARAYLPSASASLLALSLFMTANPSHASYSQKYCSNGEGTVLMAEGHSKNGITLMRQTWTNQGIPIRKQIEAPTDAVVNIVEQKELSKSSTSTCSPDDTSGIVMWQVVHYLKIRLTRSSGTAFPPGIVGITPDLMAIETDVICETNSNVFSPCLKPPAEPQPQPAPVTPSEPQPSGTSPAPVLQVPSFIDL